MAIATGTALAIAAGASLVGAGITAYGAIQQGRTAEKVAEFNAKVKENEALREDMENREELRRQQERNKKLMGMQRAKIAKAGVAESGSPLSVMAETAGLMELEMLDQRRASLTRQQQLRTSGSLDIWQGKQAKMAGTISAGASLVQGIGQAASYGI